MLFKFNSICKIIYDNYRYPLKYLDLRYGCPVCIFCIA
ncbi:hypothetical protein HMPREF7215_1947 [Pyramidobacter piscolens W5455]|uniref:Uncharacterized protein n=1 Tax=Pyramidobacter piscolens W5455 TaxID=352165 RepID=A0ABM9ZU48_9BACT|nr:hypothetical protein HMPREF7215_1947 [Pyramidobacter piscolens W5455]